MKRHKNSKELCIISLKPLNKSLIEENTYNPQRRNYSLREINEEQTLNYISIESNLNEKISLEADHELSNKNLNKLKKPFNTQTSNNNIINNSINNNNNNNNKKKFNTTQHISIMLFAVSFGFVLLNLPYAIKTIFHRHFSKKNKISSYLYHSENLFLSTYTKSEIINSVKYEFYSNFTHLLLDLNYIANFFLYFLSGQRFRAQLFDLLRCKKNKENKYNLTQSNMNRVDNNNNNNIIKNSNSFQQLNAEINNNFNNHNNKL